MYGRTNNAKTFMERSANHSTKGSRRGFVDVNTGVDPSSLLTSAQQRDNLKRRLESLKAQREHIKKTRGGKDEYERVGLEIQELQNEMSRQNKAHIESMHINKPFDWHFHTCARKMLTTQDFERICEAARRSMRESESP